jgi:signal transduction histidine kinase
MATGPESAGNIHLCEPKSRSTGRFVSLRAPGGLAATARTDEAPQSSWHTFTIAAIVCALGVAGFILVTGLGLGGPKWTTAVDDIGNGVAALIAAASCAFAATRFSGRKRLAWGLLAASAACWFAGEVYWSILEVGLGISPPTPSPADAGYLLAIPLAVAGVLAFPSAPMRLTTRSRAVVDGTIIALSLFAISWALGLGTVYRQSPDDLMAKVVGLAYPVGDVVVGSVLVITIRRAIPSQRGQMLLLLGGLAGYAFSDSAFAFLTATGAYANVNAAVDSGWVIAFLMIALAPLLPLKAGEVALEEGPIQVWQLAVPWLAVVLVLMTAVGLMATGRGLDPFLVFPAAGLVVAVMISQLLSYGDSVLLLKRSREGEAQLAALSRAKSEVMSMVSHEFRTALVGIQGFSEMMRDQALPASDVKAFAGDIFNDSTRLNRMISEMLDLDRLEAGRADLELKPVDLNATIDGAVERARASSPKCTIDARLDAALPCLMADGDRLFQVISNLVSNAVKYSPDGGHVLITTALDAGQVHVTVQDEGVGIAPANLARLFQRYERFSENSVQKISGTGLGLVIARQLVQMHGGRIWAASTLGKGSAFHFTIPVHASAGQVAVAAAGSAKAA